MLLIVMSFEYKICAGSSLNNRVNDNVARPLANFLDEVFDRKYKISLRSSISSPIRFLRYDIYPMISHKLEEYVFRG